MTNCKEQARCHRIKLELVRHIARAHNGTTDVQSKPAKETVFIV